MLKDLLISRECPRDGCDYETYAPFMELHLAFDHDMPDFEDIE